MPEHLTAAGKSTPAPSNARRAARPAPGLLALQRAAGNRAVAGLLAPKPAKQPKPPEPLKPPPSPPAVVVQRRPWLEDPNDYVYRDKVVPQDLAFVRNVGGASNLGVFMDHGMLDGFQTFCAGKTFRAEWMVGSTHALHTGFRAAVGTVWQERNAAGRPLVAIDPWGRDGIGIVSGLIELGQAQGPWLRREGGGSRLPYAEGTLYFDNTYADKNDVLKRGFGIDDADLGDYGGVIAAPTQDLTSPKLDAQSDGAQFAQGSGYVYVSTVVARPRGGRKPRVNGKQFSPNFHTLTDPAEILRLNSSYESIRAAPVSTGWVADLAGGRDGSQDKEMKNWSAYGAAAFHNAHRAGQGGPVDVDADNWEWLHIRGAQIGGETNSANLLAGTFSANSQMIPYESQLQKWHVGNHGRIWARFTAVARDVVLAERIVIEVHTDRHRELGSIPADEPLRVEFNPLTGRVVDKLLGQHRGQDWRREAGLRGRHPGMNQLIALGPPPLLSGTGLPGRLPGRLPLLPGGGRSAHPALALGTGLPDRFSVRMPLPRFTTFVPLRHATLGSFFDVLERVQGSVTLHRRNRPVAVLRTRQDAQRFGASLPLTLTSKRRATEELEGASAPKRAHVEVEPPAESVSLVAMDNAAMEEYEVEVTIPATALAAEPSFGALPWLNSFGGHGPPPPTGGSDILG
ncbi:hypothetical protein SAMN04489727_6308 [Amycolatopsis tolypomycina]|uniref:Uncharacterized protein n=1 Tax=Amycolatopsis tolypomycina TaxID=208445 RepID=A0A1H4XSC9_9PSEU|nr:hypothetical protein [Amycolatopsis tolypomycina]SED07781.1 hypothetical protein SAMN04489727_6308 [Amycolatopsis tolypomycina]